MVLAYFEWVIRRQMPAEWKRIAHTQPLIDSNLKARLNFDSKHGPFEVLACDVFINANRVKSCWSFSQMGGGGLEIYALCAGAWSENDDNVFAGCEVRRRALSLYQ
jgi:hypothetical protein